LKGKTVMNKLEKINIINQNIDIRHEVKIRRSKLDADDLNVIPLGIGQNLVLLQNLYDFTMDGYLIIRLKDISSISITRSQQFTQYILKKEGILNRISKPPITSLDNWKSVLEELDIYNKNIIIECEDIEPPNFYIGKIKGINKNSIYLLYFNGAGEWDKEPTEIPYNEITSLGLESNYINVISKYLKPVTESDNRK